MNTIALLGAGLLGSGMVENLVRKGARVWAFADPAGEATNALDREGRVARARTLLAAAP